MYKIGKKNIRNLKFKKINKFIIGDYVKIYSSHNGDYDNCLMTIIEIQNRNVNLNDLLTLIYNNEKDINKKFNKYYYDVYWCYQDNECLNKNREEKLKRILE